MVEQMIINAYLYKIIINIVLTIASVCIDSNNLLHTKFQYPFERVFEDRKDSDPKTEVDFDVYFSPTNSMSRN